MRILTLLCLFFTWATAIAQQDFFTNELLNLSDLSRLTHYRAGEMDQLSSYDRTGGNDDGFSGKYSVLRQEPGGLVIADLKGPGVVNRIWTPTPTEDTIKFYFDGEKKPRLAIPFIELFTGKTFPFLAPFSGNQIGGYYCYLPIPYEKSLKIVYAGKLMRFHQTQYRTVSKQDQVQSFSADLITTHREVIDRAAAIWNKKQSPLNVYGNVQSRKVNLSLRSEGDQTLFELNRGGRIVGIELSAGSLQQSYRKIMLSAKWDQDPKAAIDVPLHDFFGFAFGKPSMQSIVLGSNSTWLYSYLPMPFDQSAEIKVRYDKGTSDPEEVLLSGTVFYTEEPRNVRAEGKLYVQSRRHYNIPPGTLHTISDVKGKGHFVGTILMSQGLEEGHTYFFEGDDRATIDGKLRLHGTGSEDYFNGGWYAVMDRWDRGLSLPIHGSLEYNQMSSRTGGYRFYLNDKLTFANSFNLTIEHQPDANTPVKTDYTSLAFFYADAPQYENTPLLIDDQVTKVSHRDKLTAQGMSYTLYWLGHAAYEDPAIVFSMKKSDKWFSTIDPEAVPLAQILLTGLDNGRYRMSLEYGKTELASPFSIWQRSKQISDWVVADNNTPETGKLIYAGEIEITDEIKTVTIRKKADDTSVRILALYFEKID